MKFRQSIDQSYELPPNQVQISPKVVKKYHIEAQEIKCDGDIVKTDIETLSEKSDHSKNNDFNGMIISNRNMEE